MSQGSTLLPPALLRAGRGPSRLSVNTILVVAVGAVLAYLVLAPVFITLYTSFHPARGIRMGDPTLRNYIRILTDPHGLSILWTTLSVAITSTVFAVIIASAMAWFAERTDAPFGRIIYVSCFASLAIPTVIKAVAWVLVAGPRGGMLNVLLGALFGEGAPVISIFSFGGLVFFEVVSAVPLAFLLLAPAFRSFDSTLEEAAYASSASPWKTFVRITGPLMMPSIVSVVFLTLILRLESFEGPAVIGVPAGIVVLSYEIYSQIHSGLRPAYGLASAYSILLMLVVMLILYPYYRATRDTKRFAVVGGKNFRPRRISLGIWRWPAAIAMLLVPGALIVPIIVLLWTSFLPYSQIPSWDSIQQLSLDNYLSLASYKEIPASVVNSLVVGLVTATIVMGLTFLAAWLVIRGTSPLRSILDQLASLPLVLPGIVLSMAVVLIYIRVPLPVYGTLVIVVIAYVTHFLPYGIRYAHAGLLSLNRELEESAHASGANVFVAFQRIVLPLLLQLMFAGWIYIFLGCIRQLSIATLLVGPGTNVISMTMFHLWEIGELPQLCAFAVLVVTALVTIALVAQSISTRFGLQIDPPTGH